MQSPTFRDHLHSHEISSYSFLQFQNSLLWPNYQNICPAWDDRNADADNNGDDGGGNDGNDENPQLLRVAIWQAVS